MINYYCFNVLNTIPNVENMSYLELGVADTVNFSNVKCVNKQSVDINGAATFNMTTDDFFKTLDSEKNYDIIYIDANHDLDFVLRDFNNSVKHCNKWIFMHDLIPPSKEHTNPKYCSDCFKLLYHFINEENFKMYTMKHPSYMGLTMIKMPAREVTLKNETRNISYEEFVTCVTNNYKTFELDDIKNILNFYEK